MITFIYPLTTRKGFSQLQRDLAALEPDWKTGVDILCLTNDKDLYLEVRNYLKENVDRGEVLVAFSEKENLLKDAIQYVDTKNKYVFLANENLTIPFGTLTKLYKDLLNRPEAGFISGAFNQYPTVYWVKDIYGLPQYIYSNEHSPQFVFDKIMDIDTISIYGLMTRTTLYKELFGLTDLDGYGSHSYGIRLRRQGYKNYVDTGVEYKEGENK